MSGKGKISSATLMAVIGGMAAASGVPMPYRRPDSEYADYSVNSVANAEALRKAQEKRDRKAAKRKARNES